MFFDAWEDVLVRLLTPPGRVVHDAFVPIIDSGISLYVWANARFLSCVVYTGKTFDEVRALEISREFFGMTETASERF